MHAVYICRHGNNEELRYSIRSLQNLKEVTSIIVIGGKPNWYIGDYIETEPAKKYNHARQNLETLVKTKRISEEFILMNDDFFIIKPVEKLENYNEGLLLNKIIQYNKFNPTSKYTNLLKQTHEYLINKTGKEPLSYELHIPMRMTKKGLRAALKTQTLWRSYYGNIYEKETTETHDVKIYTPYARDPNKYKYDKSKTSPYISTEDRSFMYVRDTLLNKILPNKSEYES